MPANPFPNTTSASSKHAVGLSNPVWVDGTYGSFQYHANPFQFGPTEFAGLKIFLKAATDAHRRLAACRKLRRMPQAPNFSDFAFHNTGVSQEEYDSVHGAGTFMNLSIPSLADRNANYDLYSARDGDPSQCLRNFPPRRRVLPTPDYADLGMWNVYRIPTCRIRRRTCERNLLPQDRIALSIRDCPTPSRNSRRPSCAILKTPAPTPQRKQDPVVRM